MTLTLSTGAAGAIDHSIITNLPVKSGAKKVLCSYKAASLSIVCTNIGAFYDVSMEYFIAAKIFYTSTSADPTNFGGISI